MKLKKGQIEFIEMQEGPLKTTIGEFYDSAGIQIRRGQDYMIYYFKDKTVSYVLPLTEEKIYRAKKVNKEVYAMLHPTKNRDVYPEVLYATKKDLPFNSKFMTRFFSIKKTEKLPKIIEVKKPTKTNLYKFVRVQWQISGDEKATRIHNEKQLRVAERKIPGISELIPPLQLHQSKLRNTKNLGTLLMKNPDYENQQN
jgi:hypothetical protein